MVPALLYVWREVSVLLSSFMLNFVALLLVAYLIRGPLQNGEGLGLIESAPIPADTLWPHIGGSSHLRWDVMLIPLAVAAIVFIQRATTVGFRLRLLGGNEHAARRVGISTGRLSASTMIASGALAGLAASSLLLDSLTGSLNDGFSSGYGFLGIAVALLARNNPIGCIASALLFAAMQQGGSQVETQVGLPSASVEVAQGLVIILVALSAWLLARVIHSRPEPGLALEVEGNV
jgi:simple sugar transport system permease protein